MLTSRQIRAQFIDYFVQKRAHRFVPSSPVVPHNDPTLLFANAGMNQFKPYFLGTQTPSFRRVANSQKCIRAGGKHNDLEDVGQDTYHHTFFEMLGNWSFGDYFKKEAIAWTWELLVDVWGLDPARLHATYFQGDPAENLEPDTEARDLWLTFLPPERVHPGNKKDNFWEMGDTGPCGPCSEIHIDRTPGKDGGKLVNGGDASVMEIWNLVFIQFNRAPGIEGKPGVLSPLPARHVDTGMGFERICAVIASKPQNYSPAVGNYDTDVFAPIFTAIQQVTKARPYGAKLGDPVDTAYRVIGDHIRCLTFALTDGAEPSNEGRGYVLRRILRRAVRHGRQTLGVKDPFFYELVPAVVEAMGDAFPELRNSPQRVAEIIKDEEVSFGRTLDRGIELFEQAADAASRAGDKSISAGDAFKLHDTYGFPLDLTQVMAGERGMTVDKDGFDRLMEQAKQQARSGGSNEGANAATIQRDLTGVVQRENPPATQFLGYETTEGHGRIIGYYAFESCEALVVDRTPFYAEAGGQVGDQGVITTPVGARFLVMDTQKVGDVYFHIGQTESGTFTTGDAVTLVVDPDRRARIMANHTATHILNHKLRGVLGEHVQQRGSLVDPDKLRFDFSHNAAVTPEQVTAIEQQANADITADLPVSIEIVPQEQALKIFSLRAVFGEKYPPRVRVMSIGVPVANLLADPPNKGWYDYSIEFCGGTHLGHTGQAKSFTITGEEAIGKGLRRLTALTGVAAKEAQQRGADLARRLDALQSAPAESLAAGIAELTEAISGADLPLTTRAALRAGVGDLQKKVREHEKQQSKAASGSAVEQARAIAENAEGAVIVAEIPGADAEALRAAMDVIRKKKPEAALLLGGVSGEKVSFVAAVPPDLIKKGLKAGDWVKEAAKVAGGGGGGRPDMAQAGGKDPAKLNEALEAGRKFAQGKC